MTRGKKGSAGRFGFTVIVAASVCTIGVVVAPSAQAQAFSVIYSFAGAADGYAPVNLTLDRAGNLYGNAGSGGANGFGGVVYKLTRHGSGRTFAPLHNFAHSEGTGPVGVTAGPDGNLYGVNSYGGGGGSCGGVGCGSIFKLSPPATFCRNMACAWTATKLLSFTGGADGAHPVGAIVIDAQGNVYGTASSGGSTNRTCDLGCGVVWEIVP